MKKIKNIYVVSLKDKYNNDLYLAPNGDIISDVVGWEYDPDPEEIIYLIDGEDIISFEVAKTKLYMVKVTSKGHRKGM